MAQPTSGAPQGTPGSPGGAGTRGKAPSRHDVHSTSEQGAGWSTKRIAVTALFCAVAAICTLVVEFPILPGVTWLKYDPSGIVALIAGFAFGPATGAVVSIIPYLVHLATQSGIYGMLMAMLATLSLVMPASLIYRRDTTMRGAAIGLAVGGAVSICACIVGNIIVTPLYTGMGVDAVIALIVPALLPFNAIKVVANCALTMLVYKPIAKALDN
ncbi:MAG: ECF transporter S component [Olsenella sp.]|nr:ECF transporter S component [Olsenella sp.]